MHPAILFEKKPNNIVRCTACNHYCLIKENSTGICGVRKNIKGELFLLVYGKSSGSHVDPMEKKPLFHFLPGEKIFSFGTVGCNFGCGFCQNWNISQITRGAQSQKEYVIDQYGADLYPEQIIDYCVKNEIKAIAYTYNEPTIFVEYALDVMKLAKKHKIKNVFVTNGYESKECVELIAPYLDAANIDLKGFTEKFYSNLCKSRLKPVLETIKLMHKKGIWLELTTLLIPGENDSEKELKEIAEFIKSVSPSIPWHISAFHPDFEMLEKQPTKLSSLETAYNIGKKAGLKFVYIGNIISDKYENTYCPKCNELVIKRMGYQVQNFLKNGRCKCGEKIAGVWK